MELHDIKLALPFGDILQSAGNGLGFSQHQMASAACDGDERCPVLGSRPAGP